MWSGDVTARFHSFVVFAEMRTGSNFLEANLNTLPEVACYGEAFNPHFIGTKDQLDLLGVSLPQRLANPALLLQRMRDRTKGLAGFRYFHDHDPRILPAVLEDAGCAKIILTRNPVDSYISWKIATATGQWKLTDVSWLKSAKVRFDEAEFRTHLIGVQEFQQRLLAGLQKTGQTAFYLDYEDLASVDVLNGIAAFLGIAGRIRSLDDTLKRQNPQDLEAKVENYDEMRRALARLDRFNLSRTPNFEPRRPAAVPTVVAAAGPNVLFLPVPSAPDTGVRGWLAAVAPGGVEDGFEQKSLRQWKRAHPGHRSFTVIRHPLLRAHAAFGDMVHRGKLGGQRRLLVRAHKALLPEPGQAFASPGAEHAAFLIFLSFAKWAVVGQTGQKVDPNLASQTAVIQGFAGFQPLDLVIREDRLAEGLGYLAAMAGTASPPVATDSLAEAALAAIHDQRLEDAASDAYHRDYMGFGFGPWRG